MISGSRCVIRIVEVPSSRSRRSSRKSRSTSPSPSRLVDSSRIRKRGLGRERLAHLDELAVARLQRRERRRRVDVDLDRLEERPGEVVVAPTPEGCERTRQPAEQQVLGDAHRRAGGRLLGDERDADPERVGGLRERARRAVDRELAAVGGHRARQNLRERRLARPVLAGERDHLAARDREVDLDQRSHEAVVLRYLPCLEHCVVLRREPQFRPNPGRVTARRPGRAPR